MLVGGSGWVTFALYHILTTQCVALLASSLRPPPSLYSRYKQMYDEAMTGMINRLLQHSSPSNLAYVADLDGGSLQHKMDHLV